MPLNLLTKWGQPDSRICIASDVIEEKNRKSKLIYLYDSFVIQPLPVSGIYCCSSDTHRALYANGKCQDVGTLRLSAIPNGGADVWSKEKCDIAAKKPTKPGDL